MTMLMYHSISLETGLGRFALPPGQFAAQMEWLKKRGFRGVSVSEGCAERLGQTGREVVLTFDDGYLDNHQVVLPILQEHGFGATIFLPTAYVGKANDWEDGVSKLPLMTWPQIEEMAAAGIEFGSHTATHLDLRHADLSTIRDELVRSKREIEQHTRSSVASFAYPYGYSRPEIVQILAEAGYRYGLLAGTYGTNTVQWQPYELNRLPIWRTDGLTRFAAKVRGWYWWRYYTTKLNNETRWLAKRIYRSLRSGH